MAAGGVELSRSEVAVLKCYGAAAQGPGFGEWTSSRGLNAALYFTSASKALQFGFLGYLRRYHLDDYSLR